MASLHRCCAFIYWLFLLTGLVSAADWPNGPFDTSGRWMTDASGDIVQYVGVNWAGHADTMLPEGLQYQSISTIVSKLKSIGMNSIRLTYAISMIDEIYEQGGNDVPIRLAFVNALGEQNGTTIYNKVVQNNPSFGDSTTRLQVFDAIAAECNRQQIYVHLDNHVSKAGWCCNPFDGNSWWQDQFFDVGNWTRGLSYMASHGKQWPNLMSMSLRNELRQPLDNTTLFSDSYNWADWYKYIQQGVQAIHKSNPDLLVFLSGLDSDTTLQPVVEETALTPGTEIFNRSLVTPYPSKLVLELHNYANILGSPDFTNCTLLQENLATDGFSALSSSSNPWPIVVTEFGYPVNSTTGDDQFVQCLLKYIGDSKVGWQQWALQGSYYIRQGEQDNDESWALLTHDWSDWRSPEYVNGALKNLVQISLASSGQSVNGTAGSNGTNGSNGNSGSGTPSNSTNGSGNGGNGATRSNIAGGMMGILFACTIAYAIGRT